ncbi:MAG: aminotransferase class V-fold PLP-dependent enzyme [Ruminococcus sp.]
MIYLNNSATSWPKAPGMSEAVKKNLDEIPSHGNRATFSAAVQEETCREAIARMMGVKDSKNIVYTSCATAGLNMGLLGFPWKREDVVLTTAAEHNAVLRPLHTLSKAGKLKYCVMPVEKDGRLSCDVLDGYLKECRPRMLVLTHASNVTGALNDIPMIAETAKKKGCLVFLDASQTAGLYPLHVEQWGVDMAVVTGHKYLLGPQGTGALYVSPRLDIAPVFTGGTGIRSDEEEMPREMPLRLEAGTQNDTSLAGLSYALDWGRNHPVPSEKILELVTELEETLRRLGCHVAEVKGLRTPVLTFVSGRYSPEDLGDMLYGSFDIICRTGLHCAPLIFPWLRMPSWGTVRFSLSRFTTKGEVEEVKDALEAILA